MQTITAPTTFTSQPESMVVLSAVTPGPLTLQQAEGVVARSTVRTATFKPVNHDQAIADFRRALRSYLPVRVNGIVL